MEQGSIISCLLLNYKTRLVPTPFLHSSHSLLEPAMRSTLNYNPRVVLSLPLLTRCRLELSLARIALLLNYNLQTVVKHTLHISHSLLEMAITFIKARISLGSSIYRLSNHNKYRQILIKPMRCNTGYLPMSLLLQPPPRVQASREVLITLQCLRRHHRSSCLLTFLQSLKTQSRTLRQHWHRRAI